MKRITRAARLAAVAGVCLVGTVGFGAIRSGDLIANGGFEGGSEGWSWGQGLPEPGFVDREEPWKGKASYVMGLTGVEGTRRMMTTVPIDPAMDYESDKAFLIAERSEADEKSLLDEVLRRGRGERDGLN